MFKWYSTANVWNMMMAKFKLWLCGDQLTKHNGPIFCKRQCSVMSAPRLEIESENTWVAYYGHKAMIDQPTKDTGGLVKKEL